MAAERALAIGSADRAAAPLRAEWRPPNDLPEPGDPAPPGPPPEQPPDEPPGYPEPEPEGPPDAPREV